MRVEGKSKLLGAELNRLTVGWLTVRPEGGGWSRESLNKGHFMSVLNVSAARERCKDNGHSEKGGMQISALEVDRCDLNTPSALLEPH